MYKQQVKVLPPGSVQAGVLEYCLFAYVPLVVTQKLPISTLPELYHSNDEPSLSGGARPLADRMIRMIVAAAPGEYKIKLRPVSSDTSTLVGPLH